MMYSVGRRNVLRATRPAVGSPIEGPGSYERSHPPQRRETRTENESVAMARRCSPRPRRRRRGRYDVARRAADAQPVSIDIAAPGPLGAVSVIGDSVLLGSALWGPTLPERLAERGWGPIKFRAGEGYRTHGTGEPASTYWIRLWRSQGWDAPNVIVNIGANDFRSATQVAHARSVESSSWSTKSGPATRSGGRRFRCTARTLQRRTPGIRRSRRLPTRGMTSTPGSGPVS